MANDYKMVNDKRVQLTDEEQKFKDAQEKAWNDDVNNRRMAELRRQRNKLLAETDWMAGSDVTMSNAWKTYRQALRDYPSTVTDVDNPPAWPTKPS